MTACVLLLTLFSTAPPSTECSSTAKHRKNVLAKLEKCNRTPRPFNNCDDIAGEVLTWYDCGDSALIDPLLAASAHSDGAMSDLLGAFLGDLIVAKPELLLRHVSRRSISEQEAIGDLALDGGEISEDQIQKVRADLTHREDIQDVAQDPRR